MIVADFRIKKEQTFVRVKKCIFMLDSVISWAILNILHKMVRHFYKDTKSKHNPEEYY